MIIKSLSFVGMLFKYGSTLFFFDLIQAQLYSKVALGALAFSAYCMPTNSSHDMLFIFDPIVLDSKRSNSSALRSKTYCCLIMILACCSIVLTLSCTLSFRLDANQTSSISKLFPNCFQKSPPADS